VVDGYYDDRLKYVQFHDYHPTNDMEDNEQSRVKPHSAKADLCKNTEKSVNTFF
jgi:hypothetical protein